MTEFSPVIEFLKDLKKLNKKYKSLNDDLTKNFCEALEAVLPNYLRGTFQISDLGEDVKIPIYKVKHFRCEALKGMGCRSGIRIIYAYEQDKDKVTLIEIYHKTKQGNHDKKRILKYFS